MEKVKKSPPTIKNDQGTLILGIIVSSELAANIFAKSDGFFFQTLGKLARGEKKKDPRLRQK